MSLSNLMNSKSNSKLDYDSAKLNKKQICVLFGIDNTIAHQQYKNKFRVKLVSNMVEVPATDTETIKEIKQVLQLAKFSVADFSRWLTKDEIKAIEIKFAKVK